MCAKPHATFKTIYVQPIGKNFNSPRVVDLKIISEYIEAFFYGLKGKILPVMSLDGVNKVHTMTTRLNCDEKVTQIHTDTVIDFLEKDKKRKVKKNNNRLRTEVATIGITWPYDLYPDEDWNFVFGIARINDCIGCYSFARLDPSFPDLKMEEETSDEEKELILRRSLNIVSHELTHLFGVKHCVHFHCLMNGSNHLQESDRSPLFMCPICLRKMHHSFGFNITNRYVAMHKFFKKYGLEKEKTWIENRIEKCKGTKIDELKFEEEKVEKKKFKRKIKNKKK